VQPSYLTAYSSAATSAWKVLDWHTVPFSVGVAITPVGGVTGWALDITMDDVTGVFPPPYGTPTVFGASQVNAGLAGSSTTFVGVISQPIAAVRLRLTGGGGSVTASILQAGIG